MRSVIRREENAAGLGAKVKRGPFGVLLSFRNVILGYGQKNKAPTPQFAACKTRTLNAPSGTRTLDK